MADETVEFNKDSFELLGALTSQMAADAAHTTNALIRNFESQIFDFATTIMRIGYALEKIPAMQRTVYIDNIIHTIPWDHCQQIIDRHESRVQS